MVEKWQTERKEQPWPIEDKGKNNLISRMQLDKATYILTGQTLSQNLQENQKRMQKHIYYAQMTGWKPIALTKTLGYRGFATHCWEKQDCSTIPYNL